MQLELLFVSRAGDGGVAARSGKSDLHGLIEELEALDLLDGLEGGLGLVEDDEGLALGLQVGLGDNVDDVTILGEDGGQSFFERLGLHALF